MKKLCLFLSAAILLSLLGCGAPAGSGKENIPAPSDARYFLQGSLFLGAWQEGKWVSRNDVDGRYENEYQSDFAIAELLSHPRYSLYSKSAFIGFSEDAYVNVGQGLGGYWDKDYTQQFLPYSWGKPDENWDMLGFALPAKLGDDVRDIPLANYGYSFSVTLGEVALAVSGDKPLPILTGGHFVWTDYPLDEDVSAINKLVGEMGYSLPPQVEEACYISGPDGSHDVVYFVNTPLKEDDRLDMREGCYSLVLMKTGDELKTIYERYYGSTDDLTAGFVFIPQFIYDLNGDGEYEICLTAGEWEGGYTVVLSRDADGEWQVVLRSNFGM